MWLAMHVSGFSFRVPELAMIRVRKVSRNDVSLRLFPPAVESCEDSSHCLNASRRYRLAVLPTLFGILVPALFVLVTVGVDEASDATDGKIRRNWIQTARPEWSLPNPGPSLADDSVLLALFPGSSALEHHDL